MSLRLAGDGKVRASALWAWGTAAPCNPAGGRPTQTQGRPASFSLPGGWGGLGLLRSQERRGRRPAEVLVVGGGLTSPATGLLGPQPGRTNRLEARKPFAAGSPLPSGSWGSGCIGPFPWDSSQQGLTREGCLRRGLGARSSPPGPTPPTGTWPCLWAVTRRTCSDQGPKMEEAALTPSGRSWGSRRLLVWPNAPQACWRQRYAPQAVITRLNLQPQRSKGPPRTLHKQVLLKPS